MNTTRLTLAAALLVIVAGCAESKRSEEQAAKQDDQEGLIEERVERLAKAEAELAAREAKVRAEEQRLVLEKAKRDEKTKAADRPAEKRAPEPDRPKEPSWMLAGEGNLTRIGDVAVEVTSVSEGAVIEGLHSQILGDRWITITVKVHNLSATRKVDYESWGETSWGVAHHIAELTDNAGNSYKRLALRLGDRVYGQVRQIGILPNHSLKGDVMVFEAPWKGASYLRLELPASAFGMEGMVRFQIPRVMFVPEERLAVRQRENQRISDRERKNKEDEAREREEERKRPEAIEAAAASKLKLAKILVGDGKTDAAKVRLEQLIKDYPGTKAAGEARKLLESLGG